MQHLNTCSNMLISFLAYKQGLQYKTKPSSSYNRKVMTLGPMARLTGCDSQAASNSKGEFIVGICHTAGKAIAQSPN